MKRNSLRLRLNKHTGERCKVTQHAIARILHRERAPAIIQQLTKHPHHTRLLVPQLFSGQGRDSFGMKPCPCAAIEPVGSAPGFARYAKVHVADPTGDNKFNEMRHDPREIQVLIRNMTLSPRAAISLQTTCVEPHLPPCQRQTSTTRKSFQTKPSM